MNQRKIDRRSNEQMAESSRVFTSQEIIRQQDPMEVLVWGQVAMTGTQRPSLRIYR